LVLAAEQAEPSEESRCQQPVLVVEHGTAANCAGPGVDNVVDEIHSPLMRIVDLIREANRDRVLHVAGRRPRAGRGEPQLVQEVVLAGVKDEVYGIDRYDEGQEGRPALAAGDQVAGIDATIGDTPGSRCARLGPFEIELRLFQSGLRRSDLP